MRFGYYDPLIKAHAIKKIKLQFIMNYGHNNGWYGSYSDPITSYDWFALAKEVAERYKPNSQWWLDQGVSNYGIEIYTFVNEPDNNPPIYCDGTQCPIQIPFQDFHNAVKNFADGIHSVNPSFKVYTGGMAQKNGANRGNVRPTYEYIESIKDLINDKTLDGINQHMYVEPNDRNDVSFFYDYSQSPQNIYQTYIEAHNLRADTKFMTDEFGVFGDIPNAANVWLGYIWNFLGATNQDGKPVTDFALPYLVLGGDKDLSLCYDKNSDVFNVTPWKANDRGLCIQMICKLTKGMRFTSTDPVRKFNGITKGTGTYTLEGENKKMWVWHNMQNWTNTPRTSFTCTNIPKNATEIEVYRYNSWSQNAGEEGTPLPFKKIPVNNASSVVINELIEGETYMFLVRNISNRTVYNAPHNIPGKIEAEDFDEGNKGVTYNDMDDTNNGGQYRTTAVDIKTSTDVGGGYQLGWGQTGEWLEYTINNATAGTYDMKLRYATVFNNATLKISFNGRELTTINPASSGGWDTMATLTVPNINIPQATNGILRIEITGGDGIDMNWISFETKPNLDKTDFEIINSRIIIYPNPIQSSFKVAGLETSAYNYKLYNMRGQLVGKNENQNTETEINTAGLPSGFYILRIEDGQNVYNKKVVVKEK
jgi:DUF5010 C-terminal domain/Secretion system C-terminal sorting domain